MIEKQERRRRVCTALLHIVRKSPKPSENKLTAIMNQKSTSPTRDSNPAYPDRMPSINHLCLHHFREKMQKTLKSRIDLFIAQEI